MIVVCVGVYVGRGCHCVLWGGGATVCCGGGGCHCMLGGGATVCWGGGGGGCHCVVILTLRQTGR